MFSIYELSTRSFAFNHCPTLARLSGVSAELMLSGATSSSRPRDSFIVVLFSQHFPQRTLQLCSFSARQTFSRHSASHPLRKFRTWRERWWWRMHTMYWLLLLFKLDRSTGRRRRSKVKELTLMSSSLSHLYSTDLRASWEEWWTYDGISGEFIYSSVQ